MIERLTCIQVGTNALKLIAMAQALADLAAWCRRRKVVSCAYRQRSTELFGFVNIFLSLTVSHY